MIEKSPLISENMFLLIVLVCFSVLASGRSLDETDAGKDRTFSCELDSENTDRYICRRGAEKLFLFTETMPERKNLEGPEAPIALIENENPKFHPPTILYFQAPEEKRFKRQFGGGFGASHSQSASNSFGISNSFGTGFGSSFPGVGFPGVGGGFGGGLGGGFGGSFGASSSHSSSTSFGGSSGGFFG